MRSLNSLRCANHVTARLHRQKLPKTTVIGATTTTTTGLPVAAFQTSTSQSDYKLTTNHHCRGLSSISIPFTGAGAGAGTADDNNINIKMNMDTANLNATNDTTTGIDTGESSTARATATLSASNDPDFENSTSKEGDNDIRTALDAYTNKQLQLLAYIEQLNNKNNNDNNDDNGNNNSKSDNDKVDMKLKQQQEYLNEVWNIANEMDKLLQKHYNSAINNVNTTKKTTSIAVFDMEHFNTVIEAWKVVMDTYNSNNNYSSDITGRRRLGIPQRATRLLEIMEYQFKNNSEAKTGMLIPSAKSALTIDTYNTVLEMWSTSNEHNLDVMAETIFRRVEDYTNAIRTSVHGKKQQMRSRMEFLDPLSSSLVPPSPLVPNVDSMKIMIRAWCKERVDGAVNGNSNIDANADGASVDAILNDYAASVASAVDTSKKGKKGSAVFNAAKYLIKMQVMLENGFEEFEPSLEDYLVVFQAWGGVTDKRHSARRAVTLLEKMESLHLDRHTAVKPNEECYRHVLRAISNAKARHFNQGGKKANEILLKMDSAGLTPDSACYSFVIKTWCNAAMNSGIRPRERLSHAIEAQLILKEMEERYYRSASTVIKPTTSDYNNVIKAMSRCTAKGAPERVAQLLTRMENKYHDGDVFVMPNSETYINVLHSLKNRKDVGEYVDGGKAVFERMETQYKNGNHACKPTVESYNALIKLCGSYDFVDAKEEGKRKALECIVDTVNKMRASDGVELNSLTHHLLLCAFSNLLPKGSREQAKAVESIFLKCRADGFVNNRVLRSFQRVTSYETYRRCVLHYATDESNMDSPKGLYLPQEWSRNIYGDRPIVPLSKDGNFAADRYNAMNEWKMRRLRSKKNQRLLQGGRTL